MQNQIGFFEFIVLPFYETVAKIIFPEGFRPIQQATKLNYNLWKEAARRQLTSIQAIQEEIFNQENINIADS